MAAGMERSDLLRAGDLLAGMKVPEGRWMALPVSGVALDSREVKPGFLFLACRGHSSHGLEHLEEALSHGARLVLAEPGGAWPELRIQSVAETAAAPLVVVERLQKKASAIAARFHGEPASRMRMVGVTGTNGKTSVSLFLAQALPERWRCAITGTVGNGFPGALEPSTHTTPDAVQAQRLLAALEAEGARAVAMEVSSHALHQYRLEAVPFHTAVFTNLSRDHLDYHGSMRAYAAAKQRLFDREELEIAVLNTDDDTGAELAQRLQGRVRRIACH
ncbi:MAG: UDP-N-acetylmuramoylalanyl-D-glutamate--2,6-diaminopimelate ligase, partial [Gammaproteobacteria bacterium]